MRILAKLVACMFVVRAGYCADVRFTLSEQQFKQGDQLQLTCTVTLASTDTFSASAPKWQKCQDLQYVGLPQTHDDHCWLDVSSGASIQGDFKETGRFSVSIVEDASVNRRIENTLTVSSLEAVDSGIYRCFISPSEDEITEVSQEIFVYNPIESLTMITGRDASLPDRQTNASQVTFIKDKSGYVECMSRGGYPKPIVRVIAGEHQLTGAMNTQETYTLVDPTGQAETKRGLQIINYQVRLYNEAATFSVNDDNKMLFCESSIIVEGKELDKKLHQASMSIHFKPILNCSDVYHSWEGRTNFEIKCPIHSRPSANKVQFIYKNLPNNPIIADEPQDGDFEAIVTFDPNNNEHAQATLRIQEVKAEYLAGYALQVENVIGRTAYEFSLEKGNDDMVRGVSSQAAFVTPMLILSLVMALCCHFS